MEMGRRKAVRQKTRRAVLNLPGLLDEGVMMLFGGRDDCASSCGL